MMILLVALLLLGAQEHGSSTAQKPQPPAQDPFHADDALRGILPDERGAGRGDAFTPLDQAPAMPTMRVRGVVKMKDKPKPAAILEIEGVGRYTVREGERVSFSIPGRNILAPSARSVPQDGPRRGADASAAGPSPSVTVRQQIPIVLRVEQIASDGVVVEVGTLGERLIIR